MTQVMTVRKLLGSNRAVVEVERVSACSGDCHQCSGCGAVKQTMTATAYNRVGAKVGDTVTVQSASSAVLSVVALVYLVPLVLFFGGYALGAVLPIEPVLAGGIGFVLGIALTLLYQRRVQKKGKLLYEICAIVRSEQ